jgi:RNA polymerase sigma-70 factor (ECF subfamily)
MRYLPTPVVELNAVVAFGMATSLSAALEGLERLEARGDLARYHLLPAAKGEILRRMGRRNAAADAFRDALSLVTNPAERRHLDRRLAEVSERAG